MSTDPPPKSILEDEARLRWSFLETEPDACAVVSLRMELVYLNSRAQQLTIPDWFGRRCFEVFPADNEKCAWKCPTIAAVHEAQEIVFSRENLVLKGAPATLGVAVIPLHKVLVGRAQAVLLLRSLEATDEANFKATLLADAATLRDRIRSSLGSSTRSEAR